MQISVQYICHCHWTTFNDKWHLWGDKM